MSIGFIDTNVIVRVLTGDPPAQAQKANDLLESLRKVGAKLFLATTHFFEVAFVLESVYQAGRPKICESLTAIIDDGVIECENEWLLAEAIKMYGDGADLPDAYLAAWAISSNKPVFSFDRDFDELGAIRKMELTGPR